MSFNVTGEKRLEQNMLAGLNKPRRGIDECAKESAVESGQGIQYCFARRNQGNDRGDFDETD